VDKVAANMQMVHERIRTYIEESQAILFVLQTGKRYDATLDET